MRRTYVTKIYFHLFTYSLDSFTIIIASIVYCVVFSCRSNNLEWKNSHHDIPEFPWRISKQRFHIWKIRTAAEYSIRVNIITFDTQLDSDYVCIGDGVHHFNSHSEEWRILSGNFRDIWSSMEFTSNSSFILLIFTCDGEGTDIGFRIELSGVYTGTTEVSRSLEASTETEISSTRAHSEFITVM